MISTGARSWIVTIGQLSISYCFSFLFEDVARAIGSGQRQGSGFFNFVLSPIWQFGHFRVAFASVSKRVLLRNFSNGNEFDLQYNKLEVKLISI